MNVLNTENLNKFHFGSTISLAVNFPVISEIDLSWFPFRIGEF